MKAHTRFVKATFFKILIFKSLEKEFLPLRGDEQERRKALYISNPKFTPNFKAMSLVIRFLRAGILILPNTSLLKA
jgi:hypothetical protein